MRSIAPGKLPACFDSNSPIRVLRVFNIWCDIGSTAVIPSAFQLTREPGVTTSQTFRLKIMRRVKIDTAQERVWQGKPDYRWAKNTANENSFFMHTELFDCIYVVSGLLQPSKLSIDGLVLILKGAALFKRFIPIIFRVPAGSSAASKLLILQLLPNRRESTW